MNRHLITVEVSIVSCANKRMYANRIAFDQDRLEGLNGKTVQGRGTIQENGVPFGDFLKNVPNFRRLLFDHLTCAANGVHEAELFKSADDEWLKEYERHLLGQTALVQFKRRTRNNNGTTRVVDALAKQILTEATLLALEHVRERFKRAVTRTSHSATVTTVVEECIDSFLKHALLIMDDYVRSLKREEVLQTVVTIDDTTVKVV